VKKCCKKQRNDFAKEILDMLDDVVRGTPDLETFIYPIKAAIRRERDKREKKGE
jgi:hypothetical protein